MVLMTFYKRVGNKIFTIMIMVLSYFIWWKDTDKISISEPFGMGNDSKRIFISFKFFSWLYFYVFDI